MPTIRRTITCTLLLTVLLAACNRGFSFSQELRTITALSGPLVESLPIPANIKQLVVGEFTEIANSAATFKEDLDACTNAPCKVSAVEQLTTSVNQILAAGHFGAHERLAQIQRVIQGIINAARIYYGASPSIANRAPMSKSQAEKAMKDGIRELKQLMEP